MGEPAPVPDGRVERARALFVGAPGLGAPLDDRLLGAEQRAAAPLRRQVDVDQPDLPAVEAEACRQRLARFDEALAVVQPLDAAVDRFDPLGPVEKGIADVAARLAAVGAGRRRPVDESVGGTALPADGLDQGRQRPVGRSDAAAFGAVVVLDFLQRHDIGCVEGFDDVSGDPPQAPAAHVVVHVPRVADAGEVLDLRVQVLHVVGGYQQVVRAGQQAGFVSPLRAGHEIQRVPGHDPVIAVGIVDDTGHRVQPVAHVHGPVRLRVQQRVGVDQDAPGIEIARSDHRCAFRRARRLVVDHYPGLAVTTGGPDHPGTVQAHPHAFQGLPEMQRRTGGLQGFAGGLGRQLRRRQPTAGSDADRVRQVTGAGDPDVLGIGQARHGQVVPAPLATVFVHPAGQGHTVAASHAGRTARVHVQPPGSRRPGLPDTILDPESVFDHQADGTGGGYPLTRQRTDRSRALDFGDRRAGSECRDSGREDEQACGGKGRTQGTPGSSEECRIVPAARVIGVTWPGP